MKRELGQILMATKLAVFVLWPVSAYAAQIAFGEALATTQLLSILMTMLLSTVMGATAMLHAMIAEYKIKDRIDHIWLFVSCHILSSNTAGLLMFFSADSLGVPNSWMAGAIMLASFGGILFIQRAYNKFTDQYLPEGNKP